MKQLDRDCTLLELGTRVGHNKGTVALDNKVARYAWAVATRRQEFTMETRAA